MDTICKMEEFEKDIAILRARYQTQGLPDSAIDTLIASYAQSKENEECEMVYQQKLSKARAMIRRMHRKEAKKSRMSASCASGMFPIALLSLVAGCPKLATICCLGASILTAYSLFKAQTLKSLPAKVERAEKEAVKQVESIYRDLKLENTYV